MRKLLFTKCLAGIVLLMMCWNPARAGQDPPVIKVLDGSLGHIKKDTTIMVADAKYWDANMVRPYRIESVVSFEVNEGLPIYLQGNFADTVFLTITYKDINGNTVVRKPALGITYTQAGVYHQRATAVYTGAYEVTVKIDSLKSNVGWNSWQGLKVVNQLQSFPVYKFSYAGNNITQVSDSSWTAGTDRDDLPVWWAPSIGADEYDLEWAYIDSAALVSGRYGSDPVNPDPAKIFDHNASRVSVTSTAYRIPLLYDSKGHLFYRVRAVQAQPGGGRYEAIWTTFNTVGHGRFNYNGHERTLNWQATTTFAEEGKRKSVVQYYDGSLRGRQTVTKDNSTNRTIVAESFYDYQGRPVIQVLPAPTLNTIIGYTQNFNRGINVGEYDKNLFDSMANPALYCALQAAAMDSVSGASQYYSSLSPFKDSGVHKYVPNAGGFPFTEVEYTQDNTGRISRQGGVGQDFRLGSGHETKYYYNTPDQRELDALFGTEVGDRSHYFKNMVRDANGQYSISYVDMHGRTIATALAGNPPGDIKLEKLASNQSATRIETLTDPYSAVIKDLVMENKKSLAVTTPGNHDFVYTLNPLLLKQEGCTMDSVCYDCLYDLEITITDDCNNNTFGGKPFVKTYRNFSLDGIDTICNNGTGFTASFTISLPEGSYEITKRLSVSRYGLDYYRDSVYMATNHCKDLEDFIAEARAMQSLQTVCKPSCEGCKLELGSWPDYWLRFRQSSGILDVDTAVYRSAAVQAYAEAQQQCAALCDSVSEQTSIRQTMLMDMMPSSGQYANIDLLQDRFSIFYSHVDSSENNQIKDTLPSYSLVTNYRDGDGKPDMVFDEGAGKLVPPQKLEPELFAQRFKPSWAEALLPLHPEYGKLVRYEMLRESHEWDRKFEAIDTYAQARAAGYLNPTNEPLEYTTYFGAAGIGKDPLRDMQSGFFAALSDSLKKFRVIRADKNAAEQTLSLWSVATISVMCPGESNSQTCVNNYKTNAKAFNSATMCAAEMDMAWRTFRQLYLELKRGFVNRWVKKDCNNCMTPAQIVAAGHQPNFSDARELLSLQGPIDAPTSKAEAEAALEKYYDDNCRSYAQQWLKALAPCTRYDTASLNNIIIPALVDICKEGSDLSHPYGSSSVKPSSNRTYKSFEAYLQHYNDINHIPDSVLACNAYSIMAPKPYDQQSINGNKPLYSKPDTCECSNISLLYTKFKPKRVLYGSFSTYLKKVYQTDVPDSVLTTLLSLCGNADFPPADCDFISKPVYLPPVFQCNTGDVCVDCEKFKQLNTEFDNKFPGVIPVISNTLITDSTQLLRNKVYEDFMNHRLGFTKTAEEYLVFKGQCNGEVSNAVCDSLQDIVADFKQARQQTHGISTSWDARTIRTYTDLHDLVQNGTLMLPDSIRAKPDGWYNNVGLSATGGKTFCLTAGYAFEMRMRFLDDNKMGDLFYIGLGNFACTFGRYTGGIYLTYANDNHYLNQIISPGAYAAPDPTSWYTIKVKVSPSHYYIYGNGVLIKDIARSPDSAIFNVPNFGIGVFGRQGNLDWVKMYDANDQLKYFEDYTDPDNPALPAADYLCPVTSPDCSAAFVSYFNQRTSGSYTSNQIDSLYSANCGKLPAACGNTSSLQQIVDSFKINRQQNYGMRVAFNAAEGEVFSDLHDLIHDGVIQLPDTVRQRPGGFHNNIQFTKSSAQNYFCWANGFAIEGKWKYLQNTGYENGFYLNLGYNINYVFARYSVPFSVNGVNYSPGLYISGIKDTAGHSFGHQYGGNGFDFILVDPNANSLFNWCTFKVVVTPGYYDFYWNGAFIHRVTCSPAMNILSNSFYVLGIEGRNGSMDWCKMYDASGTVKYFEDFLDADNPVLPDPSYFCPTTAPDCQSSFTQYFNQRKGTNYTFSQIDSIFRLNAVPLDICSASISCDSLVTIYNEAVCQFNSLADEVVNTKQCGIGNWTVQGVINASNRFYVTDEIKTPFIINNGIARMLHPDSSTRYGAIIYNSKRSFRVDNNEYAYEVRVRNPGGTDVDFATNSASIDDPGYESEESFYVGFIPQWATGYYRYRGVRYYDSAFGGKDFNVWRTVKYVVKPEKYQIYFDGQMIKEVPRDGHSNIVLMNGPWAKANVGENLEMDWMKVYGVNDTLIFFENFDNYPNSFSRPDPQFLVPRQDCKAFFEGYFKSKTGKNFSYNQIKTYYRQQCGFDADFCSSPADLTLCGRAQPVFPPTLLEAIDNCSDSTFFIMSKAQDLHRRYVDSLKGQFDNRYLAKCMQAYKYERFTVRHTVSEYYYTLYYYDQAGNLVKTIAPAGVRANYDSLWLDSVSAARLARQVKVPAHLMPTQYRYNTLNQVVAQKSPDGGKSEFWYDRLGRLALSRNARQRVMSSTNNNYYSYIKYDVFDRITEVGQVKDNLNQVMNDTFTRNAPALLAWHDDLLSNREQVTHTVYDTVYDFSGLEPTLIVAQQNVRNRISFVTYTDTPGLATAFNQASFYSYDIHGNVDTLLQDYGRSDNKPNLMNKNGNRWKKFVYEYDFISGKVNKVMYQPRYSDQWTHRYYYDAENRLTEVQTSFDGFTWEKEAKYEYYLHGPLARTIIGQQQVQGADYAYTLQGWLKGMNSTGATASHDIGGDGKAGSMNQYVGRDALGFNLNYFYGDYQPVNAGATAFPSYRAAVNGMPNAEYRPLYNGNISSMASHIRKFDANGHVAIFYNYRYDQLNRFVRQDAYFNFNAAANSYSHWNADSTFRERVSYDANGNIQNYVRHAIGRDGALMDDLTYKYYPGTNQLRQVNDVVNANSYGANPWDLIQDIDNQTDTSNYVYDSIGNLIADKAEKITAIKWNVYGKITEVTRNASITDRLTTFRIRYTYDAQGNRISKAVKWYNKDSARYEMSYTWYVCDAQGNLMSTYIASTPDTTGANLQNLALTQNDVQIYGSSRLGSTPMVNSVVDNAQNTGPWINPDYRGTIHYRGWRQYELTNHLGNVLTTISDRKNSVYSGGSLTLPGGITIPAVDYYEPDMVNATDYYVFGMPNRISTSTTGKDYRFGFNGKENDNDVKGNGNQQDYGMRIYDPRLGRFLSVDPLTAAYPWYTPYQFAGNNPINYTDIDGAEPPTNTSQSTPTRTTPVVNITIDPNLLNGRSGGSLPIPKGQMFPTGPINSGAYAPQTPQPRYISQAELNAQICPKCGAEINPDGVSMTVYGVNGTSWRVSLLKPVEPRRAITWVDRIILGMQIEKMNQFGIQKQWNVSIQAYEVITTDHSVLTDDYLDRVNRRLINGTATDQDRLYANEVASRKEQGRINDPEKVSFIQGRADKARKVTVDVPVGYKKTKLISHGQPVYTNGKYWISPDKDGHNPSARWKMFDDVKNVNSTDKNKRVGTFDANLNKVGD